AAASDAWRRRRDRQRASRMRTLHRGYFCAALRFLLAMLNLSIRRRAACLVLPRSVRSCRPMGVRRASTSAAMTQRPDVGGNGRKLGRGQLGAAHRRHWRAILLWLRDADGDGVRDRSETAIARYPLAAGEVGPERRALGVRSVAACARRARNLALVDAP